MPPPLYIDIGGLWVTPRDVSRFAGISRSQAVERIRKGLTGPDLLAPKRSPMECAKCNPDPWGHKRRATCQSMPERGG